jgi:hypothetical protein
VAHQQLEACWLSTQTTTCAKVSVRGRNSQTIAADGSGLVL